VLNVLTKTFITNPWPMYRYDGAHSGATPSDVPSTSNTLWCAGEPTSKSDSWELHNVY
jgi:hypothetical protein